MSIPFGNGRDSPGKGLGVANTSVKKPPDDYDLGFIDAMINDAVMTGQRLSVEQQKHKVVSMNVHNLGHSMRPVREDIPFLKPYVPERSAPPQAPEAPPQAPEAQEVQEHDASSLTSSDVPQIVPPPFTPMTIPVSLSQDQDASLDIPPPQPRRASRPQRRDSQQAQEQHVPQYDVQNMSRDDIQKILLEDPRQVISLPISIPSA